MTGDAWMVLLVIMFILGCAQFAAWVIQARKDK